MSETALSPEEPAEDRPVHIPAHGKGYLRPFQPGKSGNPTGKGGLYHEAQRIFRDASPAAARRMVELMGSADERVALMAADKVLERAWGKARESKDDSAVDPIVEERRARVRAELLRLLEDAARTGAGVRDETDPPVTAPDASIQSPRMHPDTPPAPCHWPD